MTSGSVSELLSRPKPWVILSWKGRESFTKIAAFLSDREAMERLKSGSSASVLGSDNTLSINNGSIMSHPTPQSNNEAEALPPSPPSQPHPVELTIKELLSSNVELLNGTTANAGGNGGLDRLATTTPPNGASSNGVKRRHNSSSGGTEGHSSSTTPTSGGAASAKKIPVGYYEFILKTLALIKYIPPGSLPITIRS